jgi:hypothetical protein
MSAQLDELGSIRGLIEDASRDSVLWLQGDPSAEERAHVLEMQGRLADLDRIITRSMERRGSPDDDRQWSETVAEVLSLLEKAREVRGNIVGKGMGRLADQLPRRLRDSKVRSVRAPAPPKALSGTGGWVPPRPKAPQIPPNPPVSFPLDLWPRTCVILAEAAKRYPDREQRMPELCRHYISEMTPLFCEAVEAGTIKGGAVLQENLGGMQDLLRSLLVYNDDGPHSGFGGLSNDAYKIYVEARNSEEWHKLAKAIADAQAETRQPQSVKRSVDWRIGRNIDKLRNECGWSFDKLAEKTGIDKKLILSHVNRGAKPHPSTMREYAQAFAKELNRQITANDLKE